MAWELPKGACLLSNERGALPVQTLAGCSQRWRRCPRPCLAPALGPSPAGPPGPVALLWRARQAPALPRRGASLAPSWGRGLSKRSCSMVTRTGPLRMRAPLLRPPSALAGKALSQHHTGLVLLCSPGRGLLRKGSSDLHASTSRGGGGVIETRDLPLPARILYCHFHRHKCRPVRLNIPLMR